MREKRAGDPKLDSERLIRCLAGALGVRNEQGGHRHCSGTTCLLDVVLVDWVRSSTFAPISEVLPEEAFRRDEPDVCT